VAGKYKFKRENRFDQLGGYHVIECKDRDEAVALALRIPTLAAGGAVEVRPILWAE
jgi:hypothetical protein